MESFIGGGFIASTNQANTWGCMDSTYAEYDPAATMDDALGVILFVFTDA